MEKATAWLQPPRLRSTEPGEDGRHATWLELFYDLVYVGAVGALAADFLEHLTPEGAFGFAVLFFPVWWSWAGVTFYNDRFDTGDLWHRVSTLLLMLGAALLALNVRTAFEDGGFALAYAFVRSVLVANYARVARQLPTARPMATRFAAGFGIAAALWAASAAVPAPARFAVWAFAMAVDVATPFSARAAQSRLPVSQSHLPERIGLFTIIVLGEGVIAVVRGASAVSFTWPAAAAGGLGLALGFSLWWVYFANLDERIVRRSQVAGHAWFYAHYLLAMGLTAAAVGVERLIVAGAGFTAFDRWVLAGATALALAAMAVIHAATSSPRGPGANRLRALARLASAGALVGLALAGSAIPPLAFGAMVAALGVAQIILDPPVQRPVSAS